jgi:hypothetical protein
MSKKFGRKPRGHDSRIPHMDKLVAGQALTPLPSSVDYATGLPASLGPMLNNSQGCCVEACCGHSVQTWSFNASGVMVTPPDSAIEQFYSLAGGYVVGDPSTDNGTVIQVALADWLTNPLAGNELAAYVEIDPATLDNVKRSIWESGLACVGFNVPSFMPMSAGSIWDVNPSADNSIVGGHCVPLVGYDASGNMTVISWGDYFTMTPAFFSQFVDECYSLANPDWIKATGMSPAGLSLSQLDSLMVQIKAPGAAVPNAPGTPIVQ